MPFQKGHKFYGDLLKSNYFKKGMTPWNKNKKGVNNVKSGVEHWAWKGDKVSYDALHAWLKRKYSKAIKCENPKCFKTHKIFHWAKIKGKNYERKRENFWMLCIKCHNNYDELGFKVGHSKNY